jgi:tetratricopeptide (TPR) repeat protein
MPERALKIFDAEAQDYFVRGMAAARGGQRTVAARLLREAVRLNPYHEHAWLWLSGVLDDRDDAIFCLRSVLDINPDNEGARAGLEQLAAAPSHATESILAPWIEGESSGYGRRGDERASWWAQWRDAQTVWRSIRRFVWVIPLLLLAVTAVLRLILIYQPLPTFATYRDLEATPVGFLGVVQPTPMIEYTPLADDGQHAALDRYWQDLAAIRARLHIAVGAYRQQGEHSRTTVDRAAAVRILLEELDRSQTALAGLRPPAGARDAHALYMGGLAEERQALDDLLTFYTTGDAKFANRAGTRLQTARIRIAEALDAWSRHAAATSTSFGNVTPPSDPQP